MKRVPTVALCIIAKNEAENLRRCLAFAKRFDDALLIDTGSTDGTQDLARKLGARVVDFAWCDDFAAARNVWKDNTTCDWIFWLDGDDEIKEDVVHQIYENVSEAQDNCLGFLCDYRYPNDYVVEHVRLYRTFIPWKQRIHEYLAFGQYGDGTGVVRVHWEVFHHGFPAYDQEALNKRSTRNMRLLQAEYEDNPTPLVMQYIAMEFQNAGNNKDCAEWLERVIQLTQGDGADMAWVPEMYVHLARTYVKLGKKRRAKEVLEAGLKRFPDRMLELWDRHLSMKGQDGVTAIERARSTAELFRSVS